MRTGGFWQKFARAIYRTSDDARSLKGLSGKLSQLVLAAMALALFVVLFLPVVSELGKSGSDVHIDVLIPQSSWKVWFGHSRAPCPNDAAASPDCPVNPAFAALWKSPYSRADAQHRGRVVGHVGEFWIGAEIPVADLQRAYRVGANALMIGFLRSTYRAWLDGRFISEGDRRVSEQLVLQIPMERLREPRPLRVAIEVGNDTGHTLPDLLNTAGIGEGLLRPEQAAWAVTSRSLIDRVRPIAMALTYLYVTLFFGLLWLSDLRKQEYLFMSLFALSTAASYLQLLDLVVFSLQPNSSFELYLIVNFLKGSFAMFLGFAFARLRPVAFRVGVPLALATPVALVLALGTPEARWFFQERVVAWIVPVQCALGAAACLSQAFYLHSMREKGTYLPVRVTRLVVFAAGLAVMGAFYWSISAAIFKLGKHLYWYRLSDLPLAVFLSGIVFLEYRERERLASRTPVSEYHRRPQLPQKLGGVLLLADLKKSELFYRHRAEKGQVDDPVAIWRAQFYSAVSRRGGIILRRKGDELTAFFDSEKVENPALAAVLAASEMAHSSELLTNELRIRGMIPEGSRGFFFRASVFEGEIRPIWELLGSNREAGWSEAGTSSPFVATSRLLELERQVGTDAQTLTIVPEELASRILRRAPRLREAFTVRGLPLRDKHGTAHIVSVLCPEAISDDLLAPAAKVA